MWTRQVRTIDNGYHLLNSTISLAHFFVKIREQKGEEFEPDTLTSVFRSFDRDQGRIQEIQKQGVVAVAARAQPRAIGATT